MAELLVQVTGKVHDPAAPKRGDIRDTGPNGNDWGTHCDKRLWVADGRDPALFPEDYAVVQVNGISLPNLNKLKRQGLRDAILGDPEYDPDAPVQEQVTIHRYVWRMNISELTPAQRSEFNSDAFTTLPKSKFISVSEHKILTVEFDDADPDGLGGPRLPGAG